MNTSSLKSLQAFGASLAALSLFLGCGTLPERKFKHYEFPKNAFFGDVKRPYEKLGLVRSKVNFETLDPQDEGTSLCSNYFNKAVADLLKMAKENGGEAVIDVKSVVLLEDGKMESYPRAECYDDGAEGQVLAQGIAVKWKPEPKALGKASPKSAQ